MLLSSAISCEFFVLYVCRQIKLCSFLFRYLAILYDGACVLFVTGLTGSLFLCVFTYTLSFGAAGFMLIRYLCACWEALYMQVFHQHKMLITEQQISEPNSLYELVNTTQILPHNP